MEWLDESEKTLDSEVEIANDPDKIKMQLAQHKVMDHILYAGVWKIRIEMRNRSVSFIRDVCI